MDVLPQSLQWPQPCVQLLLPLSIVLCDKLGLGKMLPCSMLLLATALPWCLFSSSILINDIAIEFVEDAAAFLPVTYKVCRQANQVFQLKSI